MLFVVARRRNDGIFRHIRSFVDAATAEMIVGGFVSHQTGPRVRLHGPPVNPRSS
jgi:hypothetical protein